MKHPGVVLALTLLLAPSLAVAQTTWSHALAPRRAAAVGQREAATVDALLDSLQRQDNVPLALRFALDPDDAAAVSPAVLQRSALAHAEAALALDPDDVRALALAAGLRERTGERDVALRMVDRALALDPDSPERADLRFTRALVCLRQGRYDEARDAWERSLDDTLSAHTRSITLGNLGDTYMVLHDVRRAIDAYRGAAESDADNPLAWLGLAVSLDRGGYDASTPLARAVAVASEMQRPSPSVGTLHTMALRQSFAPDALLDELGREEVFFSPEYERSYHLAMAWEAVAREHAPGGRADPDPARVRSMRAAALASWRAYLHDAPPDDPWRLRATLHARALEAP